MYTRNQGGTRPTPAMRGSVPFPTDGAGGTGADNAADMPILIPKDYHGEFLRSHRPLVQENEGSEANPPPAAGFAAEPEMTDDDTGSLSLTEDTADAALPHEIGEHGKSLFGGLYDLLLGENSTEEETLLLLGIGLLLLWGHLDRGGLFDRNTWDTDDLALLLIGYLLLS